MLSNSSGKVQVSSREIGDINMEVDSSTEELLQIDTNSFEVTTNIHVCLTHIQLLE